MIVVPEEIKADEWPWPPPEGAGIHSRYRSLALKIGLPMRGQP